MILFKLPLLTCAFYVALTAMLEIGLWAAARFKGIGVWGIGGKQWFWTLGARFGLFLGALWVIAFIAAWCIVYSSVRSHAPTAQGQAYLF